MTYQFLALAAFLFVVACCGIDAFIRRQKKRIPLSNDGSAVDNGTTLDCGSGDGGGGD